MKLSILLFFSLLLTIRLFAQTPNPNVWNKQYTDSVRNFFSVAMGHLFNDETQKEKFLDCYIASLQAKLPNGLNTISRDSLAKIAGELGQNCISAIKNVSYKIPWSQEREQDFKRKILSNIPGVESVDKETLENFCNCAISKAKVLYPDGWPNDVPTDTLKSILVSCAKEIANKQ